VLDFYQAKSEQPTPLVIYIHGGGFVGGNKNINPQVKAFHDAGISLARFITALSMAGRNGSTARQRALNSCEQGQTGTSTTRALLRRPAWHLDVARLP
jgi:hypothetical protein